MWKTFGMDDGGYSRQRHLMEGGEGPDSIPIVGTIGAGLGAHKRFHIEQALVHSNLEHAGDRVFRLARGVPICPTHPKLANAHVPHGFGNDLEREAVAGVATQVLVAIVCGPHEAALDANGVGTAAPGTNRVVRAPRRIARGGWSVASQVLFIVAAVVAVPRTRQDRSPLHGQMVRLPYFWLTAFTHECQWYISRGGIPWEEWRMPRQDSCAVYPRGV